MLFALASFSALLVSAPADGPTPSPAQAALQKGLDYLVAKQNPDGSWGSHLKFGPYDDGWWVFETHRSWKRATTALCCLTLMEQGSSAQEKRALERGVESLLADAPVKRPSDWDTDNVWSYVYALQGLARACMHPQFQGAEIQKRLRAATEQELANLARYQTPDGGWAYYDMETLAKRPSWATSFTTAATILGLLDARKAGFAFDPKMLDRAVQAVARCRLPSGAYTYSVQAITTPGYGEWIDQVKGSLGRIQVGNLALRLAGRPMTDAELERGLDNFFTHHKFLDCARKRPIPHEAYYLNAGYFYLFGHHYAAQVIEQLPAERQTRYWERLQKILVADQETDGSTWDYYMNDYHRFYGTAFATMALGRSLRKAP